MAPGTRRKLQGETMNEETTQQLVITAERLANAAEALDRVLTKLDAQQEALNAKVDRIVAAVEEGPTEIDGGTGRPDEASRKLQERVAELEKSNEELKAQAARLARKTLPPLITALLNKTSSEPGDKLDPAALEIPVDLHRARPQKISRRVEVDELCFHVVS
jgi:ABC-type transporter Mla subunit MlaD